MSRSRTRQAIPEKPDNYFIKPSAVAEIAFQVTCQDRSAWSFEVEARPFCRASVKLPYRAGVLAVAVFGLREIVMTIQDDVARVEIHDRLGTG
jgi:hypothetical protein